MKRFFEAFQMASLAHQTQQRKIDKTPYIAHPMAVAFTLERWGARTELVLAGVLHDVLEDTEIQADEIERKFGADVLDLVRAVSEDKSIKDWRRRKEGYIEKVMSHGLDATMISAADKLHNLFSIALDLSAYGETVWSNFKVGKNEQFWFYSTLCEVYAASEELRKLGLVSEMRESISNLFGTT